MEENFRTRPYLIVPTCSLHEFYSYLRSFFPRFRREEQIEKKDEQALIRMTKYNQWRDWCVSCRVKGERPTWMVRSMIGLGTWWSETPLPPLSSPLMEEDQSIAFAALLLRLHRCPGPKLQVQSISVYSILTLMVVTIDTVPAPSR